MYYSSFGILAVILHLIINKEVLLRGRSGSKDDPHFRYRQFLNSVLIFYIADLLWGFLNESHMGIFLYTDTVIYFAVMAVSVMLWTRYVVAYLGKTGWKADAFHAAGWGIFGFVILMLIINFFYPILFSFTGNMTYIPGSGRYVLLMAQLFLFVMISIYSLFISANAEDSDRVHYRAVCLSGGVMAVLIVIQTVYPLAPFYAIGCLIANCMLHVFVEEDEKREQDRVTENARKERETYSQITNSLAKDYEAIYYINIETGEYIEVSVSGAYSDLNVPRNGRDFYAETRENAIRYVHPDDRAFAESMYYKETMLKNLEGRNSYAYRYRIMVGDEARYYRFVVILSDDRKHFVVCDKDIHETITAESALMEKEKKNITFSRIAESLASNYDVIYYVDARTGEYSAFTSNNIFGGLKMNEAGDDFFAESATNIDSIVHEEDRERLKGVLDRDYLLSSFEVKKQVDIEYRLMIGDSIQHVRLSARSSSDGGYFIIAVENIDDEVRRQHEQLQALNTEKELARRDELTGIKNKTAYIELEQSVQSNMDKGMDYLPYAIAVCDLNDLKTINDTKGHAAGDEYIKAAVALMCEIFKHSPIFRIGGDEFVIFMRGQDYTMRSELMTELRRTVLSNLESHEGPVIAAGMTEYDPDKDSKIKDVFDRADHMMYANKRELKSRYSEETR